LRKAPPDTIEGVAVTTLKDYQNGTTTEVETGDVRNDIHLPSSNVLQFILADRSVVSARPSGTEPKIKFYASVPVPADTPLEQAKTHAGARITAIESWIDQQIAGTGA
jgi:phosphoglucomutase